MRFEARELKPYAEPISSSELTVGSIYFLVNFIDEMMIVPQMKTLVFVGINLEKEDIDSFYFQDADSYKEGIRLDSTNSESYATFFKCTSYELNGIYDFEHALEVLMRCSLRRRESQRGLP